MSAYTVRSVVDDPALAGQMQDLIEAIWPRYITQGASPPGRPFRVDWFGINRRWPRYQIALFDPPDDSMIAAVNGLTLAWDGNEQDLPDGAYVVPEMLAPLQIDRTADQGLYVEPNVWVVQDVR